MACGSPDLNGKRETSAISSDEKRVTFLNHSMSEN
jgi:hypothetical protein